MIKVQILTDLFRIIMNRVKDLLRKIKYTYQRAKHGYTDIDTWNIDVWFLDIMPKILKQYKENLHGYPTVLNSQEEWENIIERMIFLLSEMNENNCTYVNPYEKEFLSNIENHLEKVNHGWQIKQSELSKKYFGEEENKLNYMNLCKEEFFNLFSKYFYNLWD